MTKVKHWLLMGLILTAVCGLIISLSRVTAGKTKIPPPAVETIPVPVPHSFECEFDIEGMEVYSVERSRVDPEVTIIGYHVAGKDDVEWTMKTTDAQHQDFVARFKKKLGR